VLGVLNHKDFRDPKATVIVIPTSSSLVLAENGLSGHGHKYSDVCSPSVTRGKLPASCVGWWRCQENARIRSNCPRMSAKRWRQWPEDIRHRIVT